MKILKTFMIGILSCMSLSACQNGNPGTHKSNNSIYYWRTTFSLSDSERDFLRKHDVDKIYMRFFDVDTDIKTKSDENIIPEATIKFVDTVPAGIEVVPTVYVTFSAIMGMQKREAEFAERIYNRIRAICLHNKINFNEIQLDCDWTKGTRQPFFSLCQAMKNCMDSAMTLSSTIRLHQLTQSPPPVDKGMLMVYNTGNLMEITTENSIFSKKDIEPYLRDNRLADYSLPMDIAYPVYGWGLVFSRGGDEKYRFYGIMRQTDFSTYPQLKQINKNTFEATAKIDFEPDDYGDEIYKGYRIRAERPTAKEILEVKKLIEQQMANKPHNNVLYHLDETQFTKYSDNEISEIYSRN